MSPAANLFDLPTVNYTLGSGPDWGCLIVGARRHGHNPDTSGWNRSGMFALNLLVTGRGIFRDATGQAIPLEPGSIYHHFPGTKARISLSADSRCAECFFLCDHATYAGLKKLHIIPAIDVLRLGSAVLAQDSFSRMRQLCADSSGKMVRCQMIAELILFLNGLYEQVLHPQTDRFWDEIVNRAARDLGDHLADRIPPEQLACSYHVSYPSFRRAFRRIMHVSPGEYRIRQRINAACSLLVSHSVKDVAAQLGYCDPFTFSLQFKQFTGVPPSQFRIYTQRTAESNMARRSNRPPG